MKFLALGYYNKEKFDALPKDQVHAIVSKCRAMDEKLQATGKVSFVCSLADPEDTVTIRPKSGKPAITDGPYTETKEIVGALFFIDADTREEAIAIASIHPAANLGEHVGWAIELRPIGVCDYKPSAG